MKSTIQPGGLTRKRASRRNRRGAAVVEFAFVAPLFLLLLGGIIEFGQAFRVEHVISNACRRGARAGIVDGATSAEVVQNVKAQCVQVLGVIEADVTVVVTINGNPAAELADAEEQDEIAVTVSIPFAKAAAGFYAKMFSNAVLSSTCTLEHE